MIERGASDDDMGKCTIIYGCRVVPIAPPEESPIMTCIVQPEWRMNGEAETRLTSHLVTSGQPRKAGHLRIVTSVIFYYLAALLLVSRLTVAARLSEWLGNLSIT